MSRDVEQGHSVRDLPLEKVRTVVDWRTFTREGVFGIVPPHLIAGMGVLGGFLLEQ